MTETWQGLDGAEMRAAAFAKHLDLHARRQAMSGEAYRTFPWAVLLAALNVAAWATMLVLLLTA